MSSITAKTSTWYKRTCMSQLKVVTLLQVSEDLDATFTFCVRSALPAKQKRYTANKSGSFPALWAQGQTQHCCGSMWAKHSTLCMNISSMYPQYCTCSTHAGLKQHWRCMHECVGDSSTGSALNVDGSVRACGTIPSVLLSIETFHSPVVRIGEDVGSVFL